MRAAQIALIGFMGAGKSTLGPRLATRLRMPFLDLDASIEADRKQSIAEIFRTEGEAAFRALESMALARALAGPPMLVSTGGGIVESGPNRALLREHCYVIWLDPPFELLRRRLQSTDLARRPLFAGDWVALRALLDRRRVLYAATAHTRMAAPIVNAARLARELAREFNSYVESA